MTTVNNKLASSSSEIINTELKNNSTRFTPDSESNLNNEQDDSSDSDLISLITKYDCSIGSDQIYTKNSTFYGDSNLTVSQKSSNKVKSFNSYSCLNAGSKLIEMFQNFIKKT